MSSRPKKVGNGLCPRIRITGRQTYLKTDGKSDKYGRLLGIILVASDDGKTKIDLNKEMLEKELVRAYN